MPGFPLLDYDFVDDQIKAALVKLQDAGGNVAHDADVTLKVAVKSSLLKGAGDAEGVSETLACFLGGEYRGSLKEIGADPLTGETLKELTGDAIRNLEAILDRSLKNGEKIRVEVSVALEDGDGSYEESSEDEFILEDRNLWVSDETESSEAVKTTPELEAAEVDMLVKAALAKLQDAGGNVAEDVDITLTATFTGAARAGGETVTASIEATATLSGDYRDDLKETDEDDDSEQA